MIKTNLLAGVTAVFLGLFLVATPVFADEAYTAECDPAVDAQCAVPVTTSDNDNTPVATNDDPNDVIDAGEISEPTDDPVTDCIGDDLASTDCANPGLGEIIEEADCADDADNCEEPTGEPEMWPMYVSFGALGAAVLIFIILNLFGNKKKK